MRLAPDITDSTNKVCFTSKTRTFPPWLVAFARTKNYLKRKKNFCEEFRFQTFSEAHLYSITHVCKGQLNKGFRNCSFLRCLKFETTHIDWLNWHPELTFLSPGTQTTREQVINNRIWQIAPPPPPPPPIKSKKKKNTCLSNIYYNHPKRLQF